MADATATVVNPDADIDPREPKGVGGDDDKQEGTNPDAEPKRRKPRSDAGKPRGPRKKRSSKLAPQITRGLHLAAAALTAVDPYDAVVVAANAEKLGNAWGPVLERYPRVMQAIGNLEKGGVWGAAILTTASVALPILYHHNPQILPEPLRGMAAAMSSQYSSALAGSQPKPPSSGAA